jgi:hypothetical protein
LINANWDNIRQISTAGARIAEQIEFEDGAKVRETKRVGNGFEVHFEDGTAVEFLPQIIQDPERHLRDFPWGHNPEEVHGVPC